MYRQNPAAGSRDADLPPDFFNVMRIAMTARTNLYAIVLTEFMQIP
jgi:hypothetical protein